MLYKNATLVAEVVAVGLALALVNEVVVVEAEEEEEEEEGGGRRIGRIRTTR